MLGMSTSSRLTSSIKEEQGTSVGHRRKEKREQALRKERKWSKRGENSGENVSSMRIYQPNQDEQGRNPLWRKGEPFMLFNNWTADLLAGF